MQCNKKIEQWQSKNNKDWILLILCRIRFVLFYAVLMLLCRRFKKIHLKLIRTTLTQKYKNQNEFLIFQTIFDISKNFNETYYSFLITICPCARYAPFFNIPLYFLFHFATFFMTILYMYNCTCSLHNSTCTTVHARFTTLHLQLYPESLRLNKND